MYAMPCRDAMAEVDEELTPLKKKLDDFGTFLSKVRADVLLWLMYRCCLHATMQRTRSCTERNRHISQRDISQNKLHLHRITYDHVHV